MNRFFSASFWGILSALAAGVILRIFVFDLSFVEGSSMAPFLRNGSVVVINKLAYGFVLPFDTKLLFRWHYPRPGDVVFFHEPLLKKPSIKRYGGRTAEGAFLLGDNTGDSLDSRIYGSVPVENILGKVLFSIKR